MTNPPRMFHDYRDVTAARAEVERLKAAGVTTCCTPYNPRANKKVKHPPKPVAYVRQLSLLLPDDPQIAPGAARDPAPRRADNRKPIPMSLVCRSPIRTVATLVLTTDAATLSATAAVTAIQPTLRCYQAASVANIRAAFGRVRRVLYVLPTAAAKPWLPARASSDRCDGVTANSRAALPGSDPIPVEEPMAFDDVADRILRRADA